MTAPIRLAPAYSWQCPCGAKNWEEATWSKSSVVLESDLPHLPPEFARQVARQMYGPPTAVRCRSCGEAFAAQGG